MKKIGILLASAVVLTVGCAENDLLVDVQQQSQKLSGVIDFSDSYVDNMTRASKTSSNGGTGFEVGDVMAIYGYQTLADPSMVYEIFSNTPVTKQGATSWTYENARYWNAGSTYEFYGIFPADVDHEFTDKLFTVSDFVVENNADDQVDVMIAKKNETSPFNKVNMVYNHILSNVNFYFKVQDKFNNSGIATYEVVDFDVEGLNSKGTYTQTGYDANKAAVGSWDVDETSVYDYTKVTSGSIKKGEKASLGDDLLLMPQVISDDATVTLTYKTVYTDGTEAVYGPKVFQLNTAMATAKKSGESKVITDWQPNYRYNYYLAVNPSIITDPTADYDGGTDGYTTPTGTVRTIDADDPDNPYNDPTSPYYKENNNEDFYYVDVDAEDGDYNPDVDYPVLWSDIDGDGKEEGIPDKNRDGKLDGNDKFDDDDVNWKGEKNDPALNPYNLDPILLDTDKDGVAETELERGANPVTPPEQPKGNVDYDGSKDGETNPTGTLVTDDKGTDDPYDDEYWIDVDGDGEFDPDVDLPVVWEDIDGDGKEEAGIDADGDGHIDNVDGDNDVDPSYDGKHDEHHGPTDGTDGNDDGQDGILIEDPENPGEYIPLEREPKTVIPSGTEADWNGSVDNDKEVSGTIVNTDPEDKDTYMIDVDGDGTGDINIAWEDIDGDGMLEGGVDRDGDGHIDNVDNDGKYITVTPSTDPEDQLHKDPSDPTAEGGKDAILWKDEEGNWKQLEYLAEPPYIPEVYGNADYNGAVDGYQNPKADYRNDGDMAYIDVDRDGVYDETVDYPIVWKDIDGDGKLEGVADINRNGKADAGDRVDTDGKNYKGEADDETLNPDHLDVIMVDYDGDHVAETELEKDGTTPIPTDDTIIEFSADVDEWIDDWEGETPLTGK